jgi:hypothetical protein
MCSQLTTDDRIAENPVPIPNTLCVSLLCALAQVLVQPDVVPQRRVWHCAPHLWGPALDVP